MTQSLGHLLDNITEDQGDSVSLKDVIARFESRGFGPLLLIPSLITLLPTGAIPGIPSLCGITLFLVCIQVAYGKKHPWLPNTLTEKTISTGKIDSAVEKAKPYVTKSERLLRPRIEILSASPLKNLVAAICGVAALCMIPLEALPFAAAAPAFALSLTAVGMINKDGIFILAGLIFQILTGYLVYQVLTMA
jgi:hypothetical protein